MLIPQIVARNGCAIEGTGLFATDFIPKGTLVWQMDENEPTYTWAQILAWPEDRQKRFDTYGFQFGVDCFVMTEADCRYANHSCDPNTWWHGSVMIARRDIQPGEEVTYDYSSSDIDVEWDMECHCGSSNCRGVVRNTDYLNLNWQRQYGEHLPPHVLRAIARSKQTVPRSLSAAKSGLMG